MAGALAARCVLRAPDGRLVLTIKGGVNWDVLCVMQGLAAGVVRVSPPKHVIRVDVVPNATVKFVATGQCGFGVTLVQARKPPRIYIAGGLYYVMTQDHGTSPAKAVADVGRAFLHEWAHYEQWRDGKPIQERGVERRAAGLERAIANLSPAPDARSGSEGT